MRWGALPCIMLFTAVTKGEGVDKAFQTLKAKNHIYNESLGKKPFDLSLVECFAEPVELKLLPQSKRGKEKSASADRERLKVLLLQEPERLKRSEQFQYEVVMQLTLDLEAHKWRREAGKPAYVMVLPKGVSGRPTKVTFMRDGERYLVAAVEALPEAAGE